MTVGRFRTSGVNPGRGTYRRVRHDQRMNVIPREGDLGPAGYGPRPFPAASATRAGAGAPATAGPVAPMTSATHGRRSSANTNGIRFLSRYSPRSVTVTAPP